MNSQNHLGLFAKFWQPGQVKTRLASVLGNQIACNVYQEFLSHLLTQLQGVADRRTVVFFPVDKGQEFSQLCGSQWSLLAQSGESLGKKLSHFFDCAFDNEFENAEGHSEAINQGAAAIRKVVVIGSDCPLIKALHIKEAFLRLDQQPVVLGPSTDGGYYLIGMRENFAVAFEQIDWSTSKVLSQTQQRLRENGIGFDMLPSMTDIDQWDDLQELLRLLQTDANSENEKLLARLRLALADFHQAEIDLQGQRSRS